MRAFKNFKLTKYMWCISNCLNFKMRWLTCYESDTLYLSSSIATPYLWKLCTVTLLIKKWIWFKIRGHLENKIYINIGDPFLKA